MGTVGTVGTMDTLQARVMRVLLRYIFLTIVFSSGWGAEEREIEKERRGGEMRKKSLSKKGNGNTSDVRHCQ